MSLFACIASEEVFASILVVVTDGVGDKLAEAVSRGRFSSAIGKALDLANEFSWSSVLLVVGAVVSDCKCERLRKHAYSFTLMSVHHILRECLTVFVTLGLSRF